MDYPFLLALVLGLLSALHCLGMCGGIIGMLTMSLQPAIRNERMKLLGYTASYSAGRVLSYAAAGLLIGGLSGQVTDAVAPGLGLWVLRLLANAVVVGLGLYYLGWWPHFAVLTRAGNTLWRYLEPLGRRLLPVSSPVQALLFGMIWGWLPCAPVYSALVLAMSTGDPVGASLFMLLFGLGTLPTVMGAGMLTGLAVRMRRIRGLHALIGASLIVMGLVGLALAGLSPPGAGHAGHHAP